ncbi:hypothetical protein SKAU_G00325890 [Synaphobranchus kaupii]|uniref:Transposase Helix-turn-helix domain-containing protein n=1 Tax=Synaphobranchus kaupii TaxID=118154 RepID=A0A9Q1IK87_SYNKA|nr:hypothetical protein SKAU_G00325890 [Synaphobranchus kaupii]
MLPNKRDHGWGYTLEVLVFVYWLACGTSYRVVSQVFAVPQSTIHRMVHAIADDLMAILPRVICFPERDDLEATGEGFCRLAGHSAFRKAVGAIDGLPQEELQQVRVPPFPAAACPLLPSALRGDHHCIPFTTG